MAESVVVADNVSLVANNIQEKVGGTLIGMKNLSQESGGVVNEPILGVLDGIRTLQTAAVDKLSEMVDVMKGHFGYIEREDQQEDRAKTSGDPEKKNKGDLAKLADWWSNLDMKEDMAGMGLMQMAGGFVKILGKAIFSSVTGMILMLVWTIFDAFAGMKQWGGPAGFIGGLLGGLSSGMSGAIMQGSKFAILGGTIGMMFGGPFGAVIGAAIGGMAGALLGYIGGENIAKFIQKIIDFPKMMFEKIVEVFSNMKDWVVDTTVGIAEKVSDLAKMIFTPIIDTYKKMFNLIKTALNWIIEQIPDFGFDKIKEMKEKMKFDMTPLSTDKEVGSEASSLSKSTAGALSDTPGSGGEVSSDKVAEILKDTDKLIANMSTDRLKEDSEYSRLVLREINTSIGNLEKLATSGKVSEEDAKALIAKTKELRNQLDANTKEASEKIKIAQDQADFDKAVYTTPDLQLSDGRVASDDVRDKLSELENTKELQSAKIKELELKVESTSDRKLKGSHSKQLSLQKKGLSETEADMDTIIAFIKEYKLQIEPITTNLDDLKEDKKSTIKKLNLEEDKATSSGMFVDNSTGGSVNSSKTVNTIAAKTIYPIDPSLMASLNGYKTA